MLNLFSDKVFHGSVQGEVVFPKILASKHTKDFGPGFYVTKKEEQAVKWANRYSTNTNTVSVYTLKSTAFSELKCKNFINIDDDWLDFIVDCRSGKPHSYDIVQGCMADDTIWNNISDFISGDISREVFFALCAFKYPTQQLCFCTEESLKYLKFERSYHI